MSHFSLLDHDGQRKYLNHEERQRFYDCTRLLPPDRRIFCRIMYYTGARLGEVSALCASNIDFADKRVIFRTLKKRNKIHFRQIPLPDHVLGECLALIDHRRSNDRYFDFGEKLLWSFTARTGARIIKQVMNAAEISGVRASAKGLRHGFAVHCVDHVPLTQVQKWLGHSKLNTTAIYLSVSGIKEREWAEKVWEEEDCQ